MDACNTQNGNLGAGVEAQTKDDADGVHFPRAINGLEQETQYPHHEAAARRAVEVGVLRRGGLGVVLSRRVTVAAVGLIAAALGEDLAEAGDELVEDPAVADAEDDEDGGADRGADDVADAGEAVEAAAQGAAGGGDDDAGDDDDGAVAEGEEGADGGGTLAGGDEAARHEVDDGDVVGVEGMAEAEGVGQGGGGDELGVEVEDDGAGGPDEGVDDDEEGYDEDAVAGDAVEELGLRGKLDVDLAHGLTPSSLLRRFLL